MIVQYHRTTLNTYTAAQIYTAKHFTAAQMNTAEQMNTGITEVKPSILLSVYSL